MKTYDLAFGNSVAVREALLDTLDNQHLPSINKHTLLKYNYPPYAGVPELVELTKKVIKRQTGQDYNHIILTNGATGAISIVLGYYARDGKDICVTRNPPYYTKYPRMVVHSGLDHLHVDSWKKYGEGQIANFRIISLLDYPSNPMGELTPLNIESDIETIVDGVYLSNVYMPKPSLNIGHKVLVGSYSKLLGINGIRLGWIATNDPRLYNEFKNRAEVEYCGISLASQDIAEEIVKHLNWDSFETRARQKLDYNREEWSKLEKYFGNASVIDIGMFHYCQLDKQAKKLLEKAGIKWTVGSAMGTNDDFGRFNLGQNCELTKEAVDLILKLDRIK